MLLAELNLEDYIVLQADSDADTLIVRKALQLAQQEETIVLVANDTSFFKLWSYVMLI